MSSVPDGHFCDGNPDLPESFRRFEHFELYEAVECFVLAATDGRRQMWRLLRIDRTSESPPDLHSILTEHPDYHPAEDRLIAIEKFATTSQSGVYVGGPIVKCNTACGVVGFVRFLCGYYLTLITARREVGLINGRRIYAVKATEMVPIRPCDEFSAISGNRGPGIAGRLWRSLRKGLTVSTALEQSEGRYRTLFQFVDLTKDFYFSYDYDLTRGFQSNFIYEQLIANQRQESLLHSWKEQESILKNLSVEEREKKFKEIRDQVDMSYSPRPPADGFEWNHYQSHEFRCLLCPGTSGKWSLPLIHGSFESRRFSLLGQVVDLVLLARRSRHFAGTRYLKRGLNVNGSVANDCEVEQIVTSDGCGRTGRIEGNARQQFYLPKDLDPQQWKKLISCPGGLSSLGGDQIVGLSPMTAAYLQCRGSIPTYWSQETSLTAPKPPILIHRRDADFLATQEHFADLLGRYGAPIIALDLVKQTEKRPRESMLAAEFRQAVRVVNETLPKDLKIRYVALDYSRITGVAKGKTMAKSSSTKKNEMSAIGDGWASLERTMTSNTNTFSPTKEVVPPEIKANDTIVNFPRVASQNALSDLRGSAGTGIPAGGGIIPLGFESLEEVAAIERRIDVLRELDDISNYTLFETGFFCSSLRYINRAKGLLSQTALERAASHNYLYQEGILRTNCIDCLDRTNGGQFAVAMRFLHGALGVLGLINSEEVLGTGLAGKTAMVRGLVEMYGEMGNRIAQQYGGSAAHNKVITSGKTSTESNGGGKSGGNSKQNEFVTSVKRYYSNAFTDMAKQDAMNLFLGVFLPSSSPIPLWDLESDVGLHNIALRPPRPAIYRALYEEVVQDGQVLGSARARNKWEVALNQALREAGLVKPKERSTTAGSGVSTTSTPLVGESLMLVAESAAEMSGKSVLEEALTLTTSTGLEVDLDHILSTYFIRQLSSQFAATHSPSQISTVGSTVGATTDEQSDALPKNYLSPRTVRSLARQERRKLQRLYAAKRVSTAAERWWNAALTFYRHHMFGEDSPFFAAISSQPSSNNVGRSSSVSKSNSCKHVSRWQRPAELTDLLTEFDVVFTRDHLRPIEAAEAGVNATNVRSTFTGENSTPVPPIIVNTPTSSVDGDSPIANGNANPTPIGNNSVEATEDAKEASQSALFTIASLLTFNFASDEQSVKPGPKLEPDSPLLKIANIGEFGDILNLTKYVRDIGTRAKNLVGTLLPLRRQDGSDASDNIGDRFVYGSHSRNGYGKFGGFHSVSDPFTDISPSCQSLYESYAEVCMDGRSMMENCGDYTLSPEERDQVNAKLSYKEDEYRNLLRDVTVRDDDVGGMEALARDAALDSIVRVGPYIGMSSRTSAQIASLFQAVLLVNLEKDLEEYGTELAAHAEKSKSGTSVKPSSLSPTSKGEKIDANATMRLQERVVSLLSSFSLHENCDAEAKRAVNGRLFQRHSYSKELSATRLARRLSSYANEATILGYAGCVDPDELAAELDDVLSAASLAPSFESYHAILSLPLSLTKNLRRFRWVEEFEEFRALIAAGTDAIREKAAANSDTENVFSESLSPVNEESNVVSASDDDTCSVCKTLGLGVRLPAIEGDLSSVLANDPLNSHRMYPYNQKSDEIQLNRNSLMPNWRQVSLDEYARATNPHLQMNEVAVWAFKCSQDHHILS